MPVVVDLDTSQTWGRGACRHQPLQVGQVKYVGGPDSTQKNASPFPVVVDAQVVAVCVQIEGGHCLLFYDAESL